ncbi:hypothetical protein [Streptomyces sp. NPDC088246]|uniref:hypothetical protein n=1 Tax=Streptomyces sp. NPDC088246 TaxID=3365842 RepID=UPI003803ED85
MVERAAFLRVTGSPIDIRGDAIAIDSAVRRLAFGPESGYIRHLGCYVALVDLPRELGQDGINPTCNTPGRMAATWTFNDEVIGVLMFRSDPLDYDHHDLAA